MMGTLGVLTVPEPEENEGNFRQKSRHDPDC
jgi:hypothetical protein